MPATVSSPNGGAYLATFRYAASLIANCESVFLDVFGEAEPDDVIDRIYYQETLASDDDEEEPGDGEPRPELHPRPYVVLLDGQANRRRAGTGTWANEGQIIAAFEVLVPPQFKVDYQADDSDVIRDKFRQRKEWAIALYGRIEDEITQLSGLADEGLNPFLNVVDIDRMAPPADPAEYCVEDYIGFAFTLHWK